MLRRIYSCRHRPNGRCAHRRPFPSCVADRPRNQGIIGEIGLLSKWQMERFPELFLTLQAEGAASKHDTVSLDKYREILAPFRASAQAQIEAAGGFLIKVVGVFDTVSTFAPADDCRQTLTFLQVGAVGLPSELHKTHPKAASIFGFSNTVLLGTLSSSNLSLIQTT